MQTPPEQALQEQLQTSGSGSPKPPSRALQCLTGANHPLPLPAQGHTGCLYTELLWGSKRCPERNFRCGKRDVTAGMRQKGDW